VEKSSDSTLDTGHWRDGAERAGQSSQGRTGWLGSVSSERESGGWAGLGWLWFCAARDLQRERGEVASEQRRAGMSSKGGLPEQSLMVSLVELLRASPFWN
jgi:hypothetical protein